MPVWVLPEAWPNGKAISHIHESVRIQQAFFVEATWTDIHTAWSSAHCAENPLPCSVRERSFSGWMAAAPYSCSLVVNWEEPSGVLIRPIYGPGRSLYLDPHRASGGTGSLGSMPESQRDTPENFSGSCETPSGPSFAHSYMYHLYRRFLSHLHQVTWDIFLYPWHDWNLWS